MKLFNSGSGQMLEQVAQRGCRISVFGDIQNLPPKDPEHMTTLLQNILGGHVLS